MRVLVWVGEAKGAKAVHSKGEVEQAGRIWAAGTVSILLGAVG